MPLLRKDAEQKRLQKNAAQRNYRAQLREHKAAGEQKSKAQSTGEERKALPTTNLPISEAKRLRKNAMARERYAERREEKVAGQQKCKHVSAARKRTALATIKPVPEAKRLKKNAMARKRYAELPTEEKEAILKRQRQSYAARQHNARTGPPKQSTLKATSLEKGKTQTSLYSSYEIGTSSSHHFETVQLTKGHQLPPTDFYIPTKKHIILLATSKVNYLATEATKTPAKHGPNKSGLDILDKIVSTADILPTVRPCKYCGAKRFPHEPNEFCCSNGEVVLISNDVPDELYQLYTSKTDDASQFRTYVRTYNNTFAFTSLGVKYDKNLCKRNKGIYTFKVQGQVHHFINELSPTENPSYLQLYFYDTEHELDNRMTNSNKLKASVLQKLIEILKVNPYAVFFRSLSNVPNLPAHQILIKSDPGLDQRTYNRPSSSQVAAVWVENSESSERKGRDILVYNHAGFSHKVQYYYGCYDPLQYPLLFPYGQSGWHQGIERSEKRSQAPSTGQLLINPSEIRSVEQIMKQEEKISKSAKKRRSGISCREYYCYKLQIRPNDKSVILQVGRLLQQYVVDMYVKLETSRLDYFRKNQIEIRSEVYQGIEDSIAAGETRAYKVGRPTILPSSFTGGPRDMRKRYVDAMALVQKFGKPDILLTMTCNPNWSEIKSELLPGEESQNRPDLAARVFKSKLEEMKIELLKKEIFGPVAASTYVVEFQKRGLPHVHFLIILKGSVKLMSPELYDRIVCAELPDKDAHPHLYSMVVKHMMHGPYGKKNPDNVCMLRDKKCKSHYPKQFCEKTTQANDSYPIYRRRNNGKHVKVRGAILDNRWVVPYNPYLLAKFDCHINVEVCSTIKVVKYMYKYIYKGHDQVSFHVGENGDNNAIDEIQQYQSARWVSGAEAVWRIFRFVMNEMHPAVQSLHLHLPEGRLHTMNCLLTETTKLPLSESQLCCMDY